MSVRPARIGRLGGQGHLPEPGVPGNLTLYDPGARTVIDPASSVSKSRNTPFAGIELPGRVHATFLRGRPTVLEGRPV
jgi:dihydroorotase